MGFVADAVGSVVSWVGDAISDVAEFVVDDILSPVIDVVGGVIEGIAEDPLGAIISIGAGLTGNPWIIAAAQAANTARNGGDIGDMLLAATASYAGGYFGDIAGEAVGGYVGEAAGETAGKIAGRAASSATRAGVSAALTGGDIGAALLNGALSGAASAGLSELGDYVKSEFSNSLDVDELSTDIDFEGFDDTFLSTKDSIFNELSDLVEGFQELPEVVQDMVTGGASAAISSLVTTGEINEDLVAGSIMSAAVTTGIIKEAIADSELFTADTNEARLRSAMLTNVVSDTIKAGYAGADPYQAFQASFNNQAISGLRKAIDDATGGGVDRIIDEITGAQAAVDEKYAAANQVGAEVDIARGLVREIYDEYTAAIDQYNADITKVTIVDDFTEQVTAERLAEIDAIKARLDESLSSYQTVEAEYSTAVAEYNTATDDLIRSEQYIDELMQPVNEVATKYMVETLTGYAEDPESGALVPNFKAEEYRELYDLPEDVDPYQHWLATGRQNDISQEVRDTRIDDAVRRSLSTTVLANMDTKLNSIEDIEDLYSAVKETIGSDLAAASSSTVIAAANDYLSGIEARELPGDYATRILKDTGVTDEDIASGKAVPVVADFGDGALGIRFTKEQELVSATFDPRLNSMVTPIYDAATGETNYRNNRTGEFIVDWGRTWDNVVGNPTSLQVNVSLPVLSEKGALEKAQNLNVTNVRLDGKTWLGYDPTMPNPETGELGSDVVLGYTADPQGFEELAKVAPLVAVDAANNIVIGQEQFDDLSLFSQKVITFAKNIKSAGEWAQKNEKALYDSLGIDKDPSETISRDLSLLAGDVIKAGGNILDTWSGISGVFGVDPRTLETDKLGKAAIVIGAATKPEDYRAALAAFNKAYRDPETGQVIGEDFLEQSETIAMAMLDPRYREVVLHDIIIEEIIEETPTILASLATGGTAGLVVKGGAAALGRAGVANVARESVEQFAKRAAVYTGVGTEVGLSAAEEAADAAGKYYETLYDEALKAGYSETDAGRLAQNGAITSGISAGIIAGGTSLLPTNLSKNIVTDILGGNKRLGGAVYELQRLGAGVVTEIASEVATDTGIGTYLLAKQVQELNPNSDLLKPGGSLDLAGGALAESFMYSVVAAGGTSSAIGTADMVIRAGSSDADVAGPAAIELQQYRDNRASTSNNPAANAVILFNPGINEAIANSNAPDADPDVRAQAQQTIKDTLDWGSFFDDQGQVLDFSEDADGAWGYQTATDILNAANDNAYTTYGEAQEAYQAIEDQTPYELGDAEISGFIGETPDTDVSGRVIDTVNRGYIGQIFGREGYTPTEEEISAALGQAGEGVFGETLGTELATQYDPRAVTQEEAQKAFEELGFFGALPSDVQALVGQYAESELAGRAQERLPVASYNAIAGLVGKPAQQVTDADIDFVADLIAQREVMSEPAPFTTQQLQYDVTGDNVIDINDQIVLQNLQQSQQTGQQIGPATQINPATQFAATGIASQIANMNAQLQRQQQMQNVQQFAAMLEPGGRGAVKTLDVEQDPLYFYDPITSENIFATPQQSGVFNAEDFFGLGLAAAEGGLVEDKTDEIMSILGGKRG